ncbi:MAG: ABC transporter permease [Firmicutes bacterium]|nr:ABC transporter permease [Alicyclobacillaceae bacterium]MCL6497212.1 ABC transporter permease [Bacillota bacterium]
MGAGDPSLTAARRWGALGRRLGHAAAVWWAVVTATFLLVHAVPGGTEPAILSLRWSPSAFAAWDQRLGLVGPWWQQYLRWWAAVASGHLGRSWVTGQPVVQVVAQALPYTLLLMGVAMLGTLALGLGLAAWAVLRPKTPSSAAVGTLSQIGLALPDFWVGSLLLWVAARWLPWVPVTGPPAAAGVGSWAARLLPPVATLVFTQAPAWVRLWYVRLDEAWSAPHVLAARALGAGPSEALWRYALPVAWPPVLALVGSQALPALLSGAVVVESLFDWPGMGRLLWQAANAHDLPVVLGGVLASAALTALGSAAADVAEWALDPRRRRPWAGESGGGP